MKKGAILLFLSIFSCNVFAQDGFTFEGNKRKVVIPFQLINNLIFVPIAVNDVKLNFLVDSGVDHTLLFSLDEKDEVRFFDIEKIKLKGLGSQEAIEGLKSSNNKLAFPGLIDTKHDIYIVINQEFNFSSNIGIPVNGIIGYDFFKNHLVEIDYDRKKITVHKQSQKLKKKISKKFSEIDLTIENNKPYALADVTMDAVTRPLKLLVDLGNSDAIWLFPTKLDWLTIPEKNFEDYLGRGFSGDIHGRRARITHVKFDSFAFNAPIAAFPDSSSIQNIVMVPNRAGSIGGEILKRFTVAFDYPNKKIYLKKGNHFEDRFNYNMSGIEIHHDGLEWVKEEVTVSPVSANQGTAIDGSGEVIPNTFKYKFELKPIYTILSVRKDSPAALCGLLKDDVLVSINKMPCHRYSLQQINSMLKSEEGKVMEFEITRNGKLMKFKFTLKSLL